MLNEEKRKLQEFIREHMVGSLYDESFPEQLQAIKDTSKRKVYACSRRAGKTVGLADEIIITAETDPPSGQDQAVIGYIAPTKSQAKRLMWGRLQLLAERFHLPLTFNNTELIARHKNRNEIWILGANDDRDIQRLRGFAYKLIVIDEAQGLGKHLDTLTKEVLDPALFDYDGSLILAGTYPANLVGLFCDAALGKIKGWSAHSWSVLQNPLLPRWRGKTNWEERAVAFLEAEREMHGWSEDNPIFLREYLGKPAQDNSSLVYSFSTIKNEYTELPKREYLYGLGVDLGFDDSTAFVVWGWHPHDRVLYEIESHQQGGMIISTIAEKIKYFQNKYDTEFTIADTGGLGKMVVEELNQRNNLAVVAAEKSKKFDHIELFNSDLHEGNIKLKRDSNYYNQIMMLQKDETGTKEDPRYDNHLTDAGLYAYRYCRHHLWKAKPAARPQPGTKAWADLEEKRMLEQDDENTKQYQKEQEEYLSFKELGDLFNGRHKNLFRKIIS